MGEGEGEGVMWVGDGLGCMGDGGEECVGDGCG